MKRLSYECDIFGIKYGTETSILSLNDNDFLLHYPNLK